MALNETIMRVCAKCKTNKPLNEFCKDNRRDSGYGYRCLVCCGEAKKTYYATPKGKAAKKQQDTAYRLSNIEKLNAQTRAKHKERTELINSYKCYPCSDCKQCYPAHCMELDHVYGGKSANVSEIRMTSIDNLIQEIEKCEVVCANCHRIRTNNRREPSKEKRLLSHREMVNQFKLKPCADCGLTFPPVAMDLDHVRGEKVFEISNMGHYPRWKVLEELDKCEVVCANCHRIRTQIRMISRS